MSLAFTVMFLSRSQRAPAGRWPTVPVVSVPVWHAVGVCGSIAVATVGQLATLSTHEFDRRSLVFYVAAVVGLAVIWLLVRRLDSRWPLYVWPLTVLAGLAGASTVAPSAAILCASMIVLGFLYVGLTQPRGSTLVLLGPAIATYMLLYHSLPRDQMLVKMTIATLVWLGSTELPAWLTVKLRFARSELARLAATDPLTGLANRRYWDERITALLADGPRPAVLLVDLDHFKRFNDEYGHLAGDDMLIAFAEVITKVTPRGDVCARWGGEEFAVLVHEATLAEQVAEHIRREVPLGQTCSIGLVTHRRGEDVATLMRRADEALYQAKVRGRDRIVVAA